MPDTQFADNPDLNAFLGMRKAAGMPTPTELGDAAAAAQKEKTAANLKAASAIEKNMAKRESLVSHMGGGPKAPTLQTKLPEAPQQEFKSPAEAFSSIGPVLAVVGSLFTRRPMINSMNAAAAAMKGYHGGDVEVYERERQKWLDNMDKALKQNRAELDQYYAAAEAHRDNMADMQAKMQAIAAANNDQQMLAALNAQGGATAVFEQLKVREDAGDKLMKQFDAHLKASKSGVSGIDDETLKFMAEQYLETGDASVFTNLGRSAGGAASVMALRKKVRELAQEKGISAEQLSKRVAEYGGLKAAERTIGVRGANIEMFANEAKNMATTLREASGKVDRSDFTPLANGEVVVDVMSGNPEAVQYVAALNSYINAYAKAVNGGQQATVSDKEHARDVILKGYGDKAVNAALDVLDKEMNNALKAPGQVRANLRKSLKEVSTQEEFDALDPGEHYLEDGVEYIKPKGK